MSGLRWQVDFATFSPMRPALGFFLVFFVSCGALAQPVIDGESGTEPTLGSYFWQGSESSNYWTDSANWFGGVAPSVEGTNTVQFFNGSYLNSQHYTVTIDDSVGVDSLIFSGALFVDFNSNGGTVDSLDIALGVNGFGNENYSEVTFSPNLAVSTSASTYWYFDYGFEMEIAGPFTNNHSLVLDGGGVLVFSGDNSSTFSGTIQVLNAWLGIGHDNSLGTATLLLGEDPTFYDYPTLFALDGDRSLSNDVIVASGVLATQTDYGTKNEITLQGTVTLAADTEINNFGGLLTFAGLVTETQPGTNLSVYGEDPVIFAGSTEITGQITSQSGSLIFDGGNALPGQFAVEIPGDTAAIEGPQASTPSLVAAQYGYIGLMEENISNRLDALSEFLALFNPALTAGTIGLDTAPHSSQINSYGAEIDLTGFNETVRIGSMTYAEYSGVLTPAGSNYRFGNGGGTLLLRGALTDDGETPRGLEVISDFNSPLTVFLNSSSNSFTGNVVAQNSAVIFGHAPGTLPSTVQFDLGYGGYIGYQDTTISVADYLSRFNPETSSGIIGFDSQDRQTNLAVTAPIDLSAFTAEFPQFYLGTSTWVNLGGVITLPQGTSTYRFAGYKGGFLNVTSTLSGTNDVVIGDRFVSATDNVDNAIQQRRSGVSLDAVNTYSGGTSLEAGELIITNAASLGTGTLTVNGDSYSEYEGFDSDSMPVLMPNNSDIVLPNDISLNSWLNTRVDYGSGDNNLELSGTISGYSGLLKSGQGTLTLSGHNTFEGGVYVRNGVVKFTEDDSAGPGALGFGSSNYQQAFFNSANPTIRGIYSGETEENTTYDSTVYLVDGSLLTIAPGDYDHYIYSGSIDGEGGIAISGTGTQELNGFNTFSGGTTVTGGATIRTSSSRALGSAGIFESVAPGSVTGFANSNNPSVNLDNGNLFLTNSSELYANVSFGANGGTLGGNGTLHFDNTITVGPNAILSPGESVGKLVLDGAVEFASGGSLIVELGANNSGSIIADTILATNLNITATTINPFNVMLRDDNGQLSANFDPYENGTWLIVGSLGGITNFDLSSFALQMDSSVSSLLAGGAFNLQRASGTIQGTSGTDNILMLTFSPVPEPSTVALLGLGLALIGFRRRCRV